MKKNRSTIQPLGWWGLLAVVVAAVGKELWDAQGHGTPDRVDALATVIGGVLMASWLTLVS